MSLVLKAGEVCPYKHRCKYNGATDLCFGANPKRENTFTCDFVNGAGEIKEGHCRLPQDITGKMQLLVD
jgi:hypothetical protein